MIDLVAAGAGALAPVVTKSVENLGKLASSYAGRLAKGVLDRAVVSLQVGFQNYLEASYNRCRYYKSILSANKPIEITSNYVNVTLNCDHENINDTDLIQRLDELRCVVVTGLAGSGKSMFMKYMTINKFMNSEKGVPLFVELRHINASESTNLLTFIREFCVDEGEGLTEEQFKIALKVGAFILVLDGFDEIHHENRDAIQKQILDLRRRYPKMTIVVSSRGDERFASWTSFHVFSVNKLSEEQTKRLIEGLDYDAGVKDRFLAEVSRGLYKSHESFLSSPLLTTIMLLAFEAFADIPDKMHVFYDQAFDTLFQKHDAYKDQFQRRTYSGLPKDDFKLCFSAFCAISYLEEDFSFYDNKLMETAGRAVEYLKHNNEKLKVAPTARQFVGDLRESVCMLQPDGLATTFVHRSFQEYFAALFVTSRQSSKMKDILDRYAFRYGDSTIAMAYDMDRENVEHEWVLPTIVELSKELEFDNPGRNLASSYAKIHQNIAFYKDNGPHKLIRFVYYRPVKSSVLGRLASLARLFPDQLPQGVYILKPILRNRQARAAFLAKKFKGRRNYERWQEVFSARTQPPVLVNNAPLFYPSRHYSIKISAEDDWWLSLAGAEKLLNDIQKGFERIKQGIEGREAKRHVLLADLL